MSSDRIRRFLAGQLPPTPFLVVDTDVVTERVREFAVELPHSLLFYAVKANPEPAVLGAVLAAGGGFDVASPAEITACLAEGAKPEQLSYGNPIKKPGDIAFAFDRGVRSFTTDTGADLEQLARHAPGAAVTVRMVVDAPASATPFGRKFGAEPADAVRLLRRAAELGLEPAGVGFHVGSQQPDPAAWDAGIAAAAKVFAEVPFRRLNIGGGFGITYRAPVPSLATYATAVRDALDAHFPAGAPELALEPGRAIVGRAGLIRSEVVLVAQRGGHRWVYLDIGRYNGLAETENEAIPYRLEAGDGERGPVVIAGPTCDGDDVLYQHTSYELPLALKAGDTVDILDAGAYTASYSSVSFNGIEPLRTYCLG
ncbi:type III PLP-dependent enzyme [Amycolatopsis acidiphila]|uniref:ornithine decarboxylase n=1 Tax=Amycolatopsis acidiphila TaxID=715473 RepID=A0A558AEV0_9PSEU|nr:type III PLP-dependent enzyme [Amycolatopsis acidiphila]TVT22785.1 type III PLP-dependent enzyme [Amycolatopsis acidiphila]UIJ58203.1 type III PLP-dependent enzyme [Amycolatopsis acidiphila]GHG69447.1 ornithine decarboxylase [Amycolatopsis acidiphila]